MCTVCEQPGCASQFHHLPHLGQMDNDAIHAHAQQFAVLASRDQQQHLAIHHGTSTSSTTNLDLMHLRLHAWDAESKSPHRLPDGLEAHERRFQAASNGSQHIHLTHAHGYTLASSRPMTAVHASLHRGEEFTMEDPHNWVDMSPRDFETSDIINHLAAMHRMAIPGGFSREQLLTVHDRQKHNQWGRQYAPPGLAKMHEDWWNDQSFASKVEHLVGDHDVDVRTVDSGIDAQTGKVGAEVGELHLRLHGVLHDRHPEGIDIARQVEDIRHALAHPSAEPHPHLHNDRIELTMPDTVTVILDMNADDAETLRIALSHALAGRWQAPMEPHVTLAADDGRNEFRLFASVRRIGSLPDIEPEQPKTEGLPMSATRATMPRANTVEVPIYVRDEQRWVKWHPMAMRYLDTEEPECIGDTDGDGDCPLNLCPRCGPKRGTL